MAQRERRPYWIHSSPELGTDEENLRRCARDQFCSARIITFTDGERVVTPALTPRPYCDLCQEHIARCAADLGVGCAGGERAFWPRVAAMIGDPLQAEIPVHVPFGPQMPLREDVDAWLRHAAVILGGWAARVRAVPRLSLSAPQHAYDTGAGVKENAEVLAKHPSALIALQPGWMTRAFGFPPGRKDQPDLISDEIEDEFGDVEIIRAGVDFVDLPVMCDGEDAGRDLLFLHYRARSLLLETNPPPEILIPPCRNCTWRSLRRAYPDTAHEDIFARCDHCGDELTAEEYDVNARRWVAYHRAYQRATPVLAEVPAA